MPSKSIGFWVAKTMKGGGSWWGSPSIVARALLHRFEQRGLSLGWRSVDFVGKQNVDEDRALPQSEVVGLRIEDVGADHIARHKIRRELNSAVLQVEGPGE